MPHEGPKTDTMLALNTRVEEEFVTPLTAIRGSLEVIRDYPDMPEVERQRFVDAALQECSRIEAGVADLASSVYAAGQRSLKSGAAKLPPEKILAYANRTRFIAELDVLEIDFSGFEFSSASIVNEFYDVIEAEVLKTGRKWYLLVNLSEHSVWPEAWVAFANRGKKLNVACSRGTVRFATSPEGGDTAGRNIKASRTEALAEIEKLKSGVPDNIRH